MASMNEKFKLELKSEILPEDAELLFQLKSGKKDRVKPELNDETNEDKEVLKIKKFGFDFYKVLGIDKTADLETVQKVSRSLLAKFHPDKYRNLSESERKIKEQQFQLIQMAQKVLGNKDSKKLYDLEQKTIKDKDFVTQKQSFDDFIKLQEAEITEETRSRARIDFKKENEKRNKIVGYNPDPELKLNKTDMSKTLEDLIARREMDEIETIKKNVFEGRDFNPTEFNMMFEKEKHKREKKDKTKKDKGDMVKFGEDFTAFNATGFNNFVALTDDYGSSFNEDGRPVGGASLYSKADLELSDSDSDLDLSDDEFNYNNTYNTHNSNKKDFEKTIEDKLRERELQDNLYNSRERKDFNSNIMDIDFGISKDFGQMIGKDITGAHTNNKSKRIDSDMVKAYKLLEHTETKDKKSKSKSKKIIDNDSD